MNIQAFFNELTHHEKRLRAYIEQTLPNLSIGEREVSEFYLGMLHIIEDQSACMRRMHKEIADRMDIHAEEGQLLRSLLGTSDSRARYRATKFAEQIVTLKEKLYEKEQVLTRCAEVEKTNEDLVRSIADLRDTHKRQIVEHFQQLEEEKRILQEALLAMNHRHEELSRVVTEERNAWQQRRDAIRTDCLRETITLTHRRKRAEQRGTQMLLADFVMRLRQDVKTLFSVFQDQTRAIETDVADIVQNNAVMPLQMLKKRIKNRTHALELLSQIAADMLKQKKHIESILGLLAPLENASRQYLEIVQPAPERLAEITGSELSAFILHLVSLQPGTDGVHATVEQSIDIPTLFIDTNSLAVALTELVMNAREAALAQGSVSIHVSVMASEQLINITVSNTGAMIPAKVRQSLFRPFVTTKDGHDGLGLVRARLAAERMGGELSLLRSDEQGTSFQLNLPILL